MGDREPSESVERVGPHALFRQRCVQGGVTIFTIISMILTIWSFIPKGGSYKELDRKRGSCNNDLFKKFLVNLDIHIEKFININPDIGSYTTDLIHDLNKIRVCLKKLNQLSL